MAADKSCAAVMRKRMVLPLALAKVSRNLEFLGVEVAESLSMSTLPLKLGSGWIVVRSAAADTSLRSAGTRVTPAFRNQMPRFWGRQVRNAVVRRNVMVGANSTVYPSDNTTPQQ